MQVIRSAIFFLISAFAIGDADAMDFRIEQLNIDNTVVSVVAASGPIEEGDAERLLTAALSVGDRILLLSSPGGSVSAALALGAVISSQRYSVVVVGSCASACASILFPAGERSVLADGGRLGFHSCYDTRTRVIVDWCNEDIARFNATQGFPFGSVRAFMDAAGPDEIGWMTEITARCFGYYRDLDAPTKPDFPDKPCVDALIILAANNVRSDGPIGPSFDCANASNQIEFLFCADRELMFVDAIMGDLYAFFRGRLTGSARAAFTQSQIEWIHARNNDCERLFAASPTYQSTRDAALCLSDYNQHRMQSWIAPYFAGAFR